MTADPQFGEVRRVLVDSTSVRAHRHAAGAARRAKHLVAKVAARRQGLGRSRGGLTSKIVVTTGATAHATQVHHHGIPRTGPAMTAGIPTCVSKLPMVVQMGGRPSLAMTSALPGLPIMAASLGLLRVSVNVLSPAKGVLLLMGTEIVFGAESFWSQVRVPLVAV